MLLQYYMFSQPVAGQSESTDAGHVAPTRQPIALPAPSLGPSRFTDASLSLNAAAKGLQVVE